MINIATIISCVILFGLSLFQLSLILGAPIGKYAWGGSHKVLPKKLKIGSMISIFLYGIFAIIILSKAGMPTFIPNNTVVNVGIWVLAVYFAVGVIMNGISRSKPERNLMTPIALVLAITACFIALS